MQELEEELEDEDEGAVDIDLDKDPNWLKVKQAWPNFAAIGLPNPRFI